MTRIIGLTGGIGSGKTLVAKHLQSLGVPVYIADDEARKLMESKEIIHAVTEAFGNEITRKGKIDREKLSQLVFNSPEKLDKLNNIVHPKVHEHFKAWVEKHKDFPIVVKEAAILFESGSYKDCDAIITVIAPLQIRLQRVVERDNTSPELVLQRMQSQWTDEQRISKSDYVIHNISVKETYKQTEEILNLLTNQ
ncbi:dephospho-CoA kinase [Flavobacterium sp.]